MLTLTNFLTIGGATGITVAVVSVIHAVWPQGSDPWVTWGVAELVVFLGGLSTESLTAAHGCYFLSVGWSSRPPP
jgi:flagellar motor component MotA